MSVSSVKLLYSDKLSRTFYFVSTLFAIHKNLGNTKYLFLMPALTFRGSFNHSEFLRIREEPQPGHRNREEHPARSFGGPDYISLDFFRFEMKKYGQL